MDLEKYSIPHKQYFFNFPHKKYLRNFSRNCSDTNIFGGGGGRIFWDFLDMFFSSIYSKTINLLCACKIAFELETDF